MPTLFAAAAVCVVFAGCGTKTPLTLPPQSTQKAPLAASVGGSTGAMAEAPTGSRP